jgi:hypothetical protein
VALRTTRRSAVDAFAEIALDVARCGDRGCESESDAGEGAGREQEQEDAPIEYDFPGAGDLPVAELQQKRRTPDGDEQAANGSSEGEDRAFDQELADEASTVAPRADRIATSRERAAARASSRFATLKHAIKRTSPTAPRSISNEVRALPTTTSFSGVRRTPRPVVRAWVLLFQSFCNHAHFVAGRFEGRTRFQSCGRGQIVILARVLADGREIERDVDFGAGGAIGGKLKSLRDHSDSR